MAHASLRFQYQQIARAIQNQILRGELRSGDRLPSERALGERFQVQRNTVRAALALLETEGHISTSERRGSFVLPPMPAKPRGDFLVNIAEGSGPNGSALFEGIRRGAESSGFGVRRTSTDPLPGSTMNRVPRVESMPSAIAGVILWPHLPIDTEALVQLSEALPVVLVDHRVSGVEIDCVRFDDVAGGVLVTEHLFSLGHRRIAFLTDEIFADSVQARWNGYVLAHERAGVPCDHRLSLLYHFIDPTIFTLTLRHLLADPATRPTALVCSNDLVAFTALRLLSIEGLRVPLEMAVTGYGNATPEYASAISLTTVHQPFLQMGLEAARIVTERIRQDGRERRASPVDICLPVSLVVRGST